MKTNIFANIGEMDYISARIANDIGEIKFLYLDNIDVLLSGNSLPHTRG